ncbi:DUF3311 domain-containing protein [Solihabitans fulvus]|uniref:DUF3311 domain-containing protein n=1 Tax=Solihabitans fulvus TaxID=1892852 RepID=A0A5B2XKP4_9PSEU|nr:DUF3311 domain-containing protein [Solihabitans fulvus]KAA2263480.1 DUF3311 domain-containing protein [Solihabitans fulvus]
MPPAQPPRAGSHDHGSGLRWNAWNLVLLAPLLMLVTPWFNFDGPRLVGLPFFYWYQLAFVPVSAICVAIVYVKTKDEPTSATDHSGRPTVDDLDSSTSDRRKR